MAYSDVILAEPSLVAYWGMEDAAPGGALTDTSGNGNHGTIYAAMLTTGGLTPQLGTRALTGFGSASLDRQVRVPTSTAWANGRPALSLECWFTSTSTAVQGLLGRTNSGTFGTQHAGNMRLFLNTNGRLNFQVFSTAYQPLGTLALTNNLADGAVHHVVATWDGTTARLYVDGVLVGSTAMAGSQGSPDSTVPFFLGGMGVASNPASSTFPLVGTIDAAAYYSSALTAEQVSEHYIAGTVSGPPPPGGDPGVGSGTTGPAASFLQAGSARRRPVETPQVWVAGAPVAALTPWGDLEWSTVWPGGSEALSFGVSRSHRYFRPDAIVELRWGGLSLWRGVLDEPMRGEPLVASGLYRLGEQEPALDEFGNATSIPDTAVATAITRGLPWAKAGVLDALYAPIEFTEPLSLSKLLDHFTLTAPGAKGWGIGPDGMLDFRPWPAASMHVLPGVDGLGITRDGYASRLTARYWDGSAYVTLTRVDTEAELRWGRVPHVIGQVLAGGAVLTAAQAEQTLDGMLERGRSQIGWTTPIEVAPGDVVNHYGEAIALETIAAGLVARVQDLQEDVADLAGRTWQDMPLARVEHREGKAILTPRGLVSPMHDVLSGATA